MPHERRRLKVGVTLFVRDGYQSLWENGIFQNCFFLVMLLQASPLVHSAVIVNGGDAPVRHDNPFLADLPVPIIDLSAARESLDVIIEMSAQLDGDWACDFHARGGRIIGMRVANDYVIDIERMMFNRPQGMLVSHTPYEVIWTLPAFERTCAAYYAHAFRAPVQVMPHLWSPVLLERAITAAALDQPFAYQPGSPRWRLAILEPNICMVKTSHLAMLACELAYRQQPGFIENLRVYNTLHMKDNAQFFGFATSLELVKHHLATFEARFPIYEVMARHTDAIISHHWENGQNYLYYEALHGGYPLIHNSAFLGGCGYRYAGFDCEQGALALREAFAVHDAQLVSYRRSAAQFLATLDPLAPPNVACFTAALEQACAP